MRFPSKLSFFLFIGIHSSSSSKYVLASIQNLSLPAPMQPLRSLTSYIYLSIVVGAILAIHFIVNVDLSLLVNHDDGKGTYIAFCLNVKEDIDVAEWVEYHYRIGVDRVYVFDNGSKPPLKPALQSLIDNGIVHYEYTYGFDSIFTIVATWMSDKYHSINKHVYMYEKCMSKFGHKHRWLMSIDSDEFIVLANKNQSFPEFMKTYEKFGGLRIPWKVYGSSGLVNRPLGGVLGHYNKCDPNPNPNFSPFKSIVQPIYCTGESMIHDWPKIHGYFSVDEHQRRTLNLTYDFIHINHYAVKSKEDYELKCKRGSGNAVRRGQPYWDRVESTATSDCPVLKMPPRRQQSRQR